DPLVGEVTAEAAREVWGVDLAPDCLARLEHQGGLALGQARRLVRRAGVPEPEIEAGLPRWCALHAERYVERLAETDSSAWRAAGAHEAGIPVVGVHGDPHALVGADVRISALASLPEALSSLRP